ncbi:DUF2252 family protein [Gordonia aurantiaca]|uniref:DUF2252 family protein n=1 Tax=Gordonia sp. B21 TaxID=3151852 RepID=UPI00326601A6
MFDLNDFEESHVGPFEWDVKRLAASFVIAGRNRRIRRQGEPQDRQDRREDLPAHPQAQCLDDHARVLVRRDRCRVGARRDRADVDISMTKRTRKALRTARHRDSAQALAKLCEIDSDGSAHIRSDPPLLVPLSERFPEHTAAVLGERVRERIDSYRASLPLHVQSLPARFTIVDIAFKVVGCGQRRHAGVDRPDDGKNLDDPLFLQVKEAQRSVLAGHVPASGFDNQGQRVVEGQRLLQAASDLFPGWSSGIDEHGERRDFSVRQLRDGKGSVVVEPEPDGMTRYARLCGLALGQAHARTGTRFDIAGYLERTKGFADAIADFSVSYADLNEVDHVQMTAAINRGELEVRDLVV